MRRLLAIAFIGVALWPVVALGDEPPRAGFGRRSLVTEIPGISLGGYGGRGLLPSHGVHDETHAKAMVIEEGGVAVAVVALDLIGVQRTVLDAIEKKGFPPRVRLGRDAILVCASHTHAGYGRLARPTGAPALDTLFFLTCGPFHEAFFDEVATKVRDAIVDAWDDLRPARLGVGTADGIGLSRNRGRSGGVVDPEIGVVAVAAPDGAVRGLLVNFAAHPTILGGENLLLSAGWPGAMARDLEARHPGSTVLFANGAEGDLSIRAPEGEHADDWAKVEAAGRAVAGRVDAALPAIEMRDRARVAARAVECDMPPPEERGGRPLAPRRGIFQQVALGDALLMGVPGEPCCRIGLDMKSAVRGKGVAHPFVVGLAADHLGYFVHAEDHGGDTHRYEKSLNFYGAGIGAFIVDVHLRMLDPRPAPRESGPF